MAATRGVLISRRFAERIGDAVADWERSPAPSDRSRSPRRAVDVPLRVYAVYDNFLACRLWDPVSGALHLQVKDNEPATGIVYVAKPHLLQRQSWDGKTIDGITYSYVSTTERQATDGSTTEDQAIVPAYNIATWSGVDSDGYRIITFDGDLIWARAGYTDLTGDDSEPVCLRDLNEDGRAWAKV